MLATNSPVIKAATASLTAMAVPSFGEFFRDIFQVFLSIIGPGGLDARSVMQSASHQYTRLPDEPAVGDCPDRGRAAVGGRSGASIADSAAWSIQGSS